MQCSSMANRTSISSNNTGSTFSGTSGYSDQDSDRSLTSTRISLPQLQIGIEAMKRSIELLTAAEKRQNGGSHSEQTLEEAMTASE